MNTVLDHSSDLGADSLKMRLDLLIGNPENFQTIGLQAFITGSSRESRPQGPLSYGTRKLCSIRVNLPDLPKAPPLGELAPKVTERAITYYSSVISDMQKDIAKRRCARRQTPPGTP